jgi:SAM-dependent methyltransferase
METSIVQIPSTEVSFHPLSFCDPKGRVFWWEGQLYRGITHENVDFVQQLFRDAVVQNLMDKGLLIQTELTGLSLDGYGLVLKHRTVPFVTYCYEWCSDMLKDAALLVINLELELARYGLTLQDPHPWNVLFDGPRPVYVDFGSIGPDGGHQLWWAQEFRRFFIHPLQLTVHGYGRVARSLLHDPRHGIRKHELTALLSGRSLRFAMKQAGKELAVAMEEAAKRLVSVAKEQIPTPFRPVIKKRYASLKTALPRPKGLDFLDKVARELTAITGPTRQTDWSQSYKDSYPPFTPSEEWTQKHRNVHRVLSDLHPSSVLDIGSNRGWYTQLAARLGSEVVALDTDEICISQLYSEAREQHLPILPLVMDFCLPSPGYGVCYQEGAPAIKRLHCDLVLALALVHHLVFGRQLNFEQISDGLASFSKRQLLVEFISGEDEDVQQTWPHKYSWYTLENFLAALGKEFRTIKSYPSETEHRILLLCEK